MPPDDQVIISAPSPRDGSAAELVGGLISDAKDLVVAHGEKVKLEVRDELGALKDTMKLVGVAVGAVVIAGLLAAQAIVLGLVAATGMPAWAAYAIVAIVAAIAGYIAYKKRPPADRIDLIPEDALAGAKRDAKMVANAVTS